MIRIDKATALRITRKYENFLLVLLLVLQFQDGIMTHSGFHLFGAGIEANPMIRYLIENFGDHVGLVVPKFLGILFLWFIYKTKQADTYNVLTIMGLTFLSGLYLWSCYRWCEVLGYI